MDTAQWPQEERIMEHKISNTCSSSATLATTSCSNNSNNNNNKPSSTSSLERKVRPQKDEAVNCPRCNSANTKFCYYNNYSLTQPRYFCKTCKRYWTEGGSLRNIPVGGGSRKNKRCSSSSISSPPSKRISSHDLVAAAQSHYLSSNPNNNNNIDYNKILTAHQPQDLNLGFPPTTQHQQHQHHDFTSLSEFIQLPTMETTPNPKGQLPNSTTATTSADHQQQHRHLSALELLNGLTSSRGLTPFIKMAVPDPNNNNNDDDNGVYSSGYPSLLDFKPNLNFSLDGLGNGYGRLQGEVKNSGGRLLFPFEDLKQASSITTDGGDHNNNSNDNDVQNRVEHNGDSTTGYWSSGMLDAGGSW